MKLNAQPNLLAVFFHSVSNSLEQLSSNFSLRDLEAEEFSRRIAEIETLLQSEKDQAAEQMVSFFAPLLFEKIFYLSSFFCFRSGLKRPSEFSRIKIGIISAALPI